MDLTAAVSTSSAPRPGGAYSQGVSVAPSECRLLFVSGQLGLDPTSGDLVEGGVAAETKRTLENIEAIVEAAGGSARGLVKLTIILSDLDDFSEMNSAYSDFLASRGCAADAAPPPARTTFQAGRKMPKNAKVEIDAVAAVLPSSAAR